MRSIANPLYDVVFKYMMEDPEVARSFLEVLLNLKLDSVVSRQQEQVIQSENSVLKLQRLDFVAEIIHENGNKSKVMIEIQKANKDFDADLKRFRKYLSVQYSRDSLPILSVYILGFRLSDLESAFVHINRGYQDVYEENEIVNRSGFAEALSHDLWIVQVPRLKALYRNRLTSMLNIFNQQYLSQRGEDGRRILNLPEIQPDKTMDLILTRLEKAKANEEIVQKMEDEEYLLELEEKILGEKDKIILAREQQLEEEKKRTELERTRAEEERLRAEEAIQKQQEQTRQMIQILRKTGKTDTEIESLLQIQLIDFE